MRKLITAGAIGLAAVSVLGIWLVVSKFRELEAGLRAETDRSSSLTRELHERTRALEQTNAEAAAARNQAEAARNEAEAASRDVEQMSAAAQAAQDQMQAAEKARMDAERESQEALDRENRARTELAELRRRREQELDRMQQALSKIAPTRRTPSGMVIELANDSFYFDFDKATLRPENREILSRIAGVLLASEGYRLFVYGHTDDTGPASYNQELSLRRAGSVADYLRHAGVPDDLMRVEGFGKSSPREQNNSPQGRQKNRRVEIGIVDSIIEYQGLAPKA
jgi:outer membrane protein OmpA-like peptidoglycan-associated protein